MPAVLITGTSSGIGHACIAHFNECDWQVFATVRHAADADRLLEEFPEITVLQVELTDEAQVARVIGGALRDAGGVDVVVNNAGASIIGAVEELTLADFRAQLDLNLLATIQIAQLALPFMRTKGHGRIIQVSSGFGRVALPMFGAYCASKYALEGYSEALAHEVTPFGIGVSLIEPGPVITHFDKNRRDAGNYRTEGPYAAMYKTMRARLVNSRDRGASTGDEVAAVIFRAATAENPALRYTVGEMGFGAALAARLVPDRLKQLAVGRLLRK